jgi:hypothetical protein
MNDQLQSRFPIDLIGRRNAMAIVACAALSAAARAQSAQLDGRRFEGVFLERGKTSGDADTLLFQGGRFRSAACDRYGYSDAPYRVIQAGDAMTFEAETTSPKHGKLIWRGVIRGDYFNATAMMVRDGKPSLEHWVVAAVPR